MTSISKCACCRFGLLLLLAGAPAMAQQVQPTPMAIKLVDVAKEAGLTLLNITGGQNKDYIAEVNGNGAAFFDYDNDGLLDVLIVNGSTLEHMKTGGDQMLALYRNNGDGTFSDVTAKAGLIKKGWGMGVCIADTDNDGFEDIFITGFGPNVLFHNNGNGTFSDVTARAGITGSHWSTGCSFGDYDRDGYVDLYVANYIAFDPRTVPKRGSNPFCKYMGIDVMCGPRGLPGEPDVLYHNNGDGTFTDVTQRAGIRDPGYPGFTAAFTDFDNDGWPDIFVANDSAPNFLFHNNHDGTFSEVGLFSGISLNGEGREQSNMGVAIGDYNNDGYLDFYITVFSHDTGTLFKNNGDGTFTDATASAGFGQSSMPYLGWGTAFVDLDNDGFPDLFVANGHVYPEIDRFALGSTYYERKQLYQNLGNATFREVTTEIGGGLLIEKSSRGVAYGDYDNDGNLDLLIVNLNDRPTLLHNNCGSRNHWLTLKLIGTKSNRDAIGARVMIQVGGRRQLAEVQSGGSYLSNSDLRLHFGLGGDTRVSNMEIRWPSGLIEKLDNVMGDQILVITEGRGFAKALRTSESDGVSRSSLPRDNGPTGRRKEGKGSICPDSTGGCR